MSAKRYQVFVSSTFTDLRDERQTAVEAILKAGHIPAGMELFAAGDQSQLEVIREWIDRSDIFLLILGGRYGSIEPKTGKSYIQLEYEYAIERHKPLFAVVMTDGAIEAKVRTNGSSVLETENASALKDFRALVRSRVCKQFTDSPSLQAAIYESLFDILRKHESALSGWVSGRDAVDALEAMQRVSSLSGDNAALRRENAALVAALDKARAAVGPPLPPRDDPEMQAIVDALRQADVALGTTAFDYLMGSRGELVLGMRVPSNAIERKGIADLAVFGLVEIHIGDDSDAFAKTTTLGNRLLAFQHHRAVVVGGQ